MKRAYWAGFAVSGLMTIGALSGCSGDPDPGNTNGTAGTATAGTGSGTAGGTGTGGGAPLTGTQLQPPASYTVLSSAEAPPSTTPAPAKYGSLVCSSCHGANGEGGLSGPEIRHVSADYAKWIVRNGRANTSMVAFDAASLTDAELTEIIAWLDAQPRPTTPQGLYRDFCGNCHGPMTPSGGAVPVSAQSLPTATVTTTVRSGEGTDPSMRNAYMPKFDATALTDAELAQINTFLGSK